MTEEPWALWLANLPKPVGELVLDEGAVVEVDDTTGKAIKWVSGKALAGTAITGGGAGELISVLLA